MKFRLNADHSEIGKHEKIVSGYIGVEIDGQWYPEENWYDDFNLLFDSWIDAAENLRKGSESDGLLFYCPLGQVRITRVPDQMVSIEWMEYMQPPATMKSVAQECLSLSEFLWLMRELFDHVDEEIWEGTDTRRKWNEIRSGW